MNVLLINGSPNKNGCTHTALLEIATKLQAEGINTTEHWIGDKAIMPCVGLTCRACETSGYCIYKDDTVNEAIDLAIKADGIIIGSPVYYAAPNGSLCAFLDRMFFLKEKKYAYKPSAAIVSCRRGGASAAFDRLNKYFTISSMPIVSSPYWNSVHGMTPDEVKKDIEGMQTMRTLATNMAWLLKCIEQAKQAGIQAPILQPRTHTNFIRTIE